MKIFTLESSSSLVLDLIRGAQTQGLAWTDPALIDQDLPKGSRLLCWGTSEDTPVGALLWYPGPPKSEQAQLWALFSLDKATPPWKEILREMGPCYRLEWILPDGLQDFSPAYTQVLTLASTWGFRGVGLKNGYRKTKNAWISGREWELLAPWLEAPAAVPLGITVYTDGGCIGNPGKGAWAWFVLAGDREWSGTGGLKATTNNQMELQAVIEALIFIGKQEEWKRLPIRIHTDSQYVKNGITTWIHGWERNGWKTASKEPVKNKEFWQRLQELNTAYRPQWTWVKGHAGNRWNEACDQLVRQTMEGL